MPLGRYPQSRVGWTGIHRAEDVLSPGEEPGKLEEQSAKVLVDCQVDAWRRYCKGPRDRLYVTGDLGEYRSDGDVRVSGRIDSQAKIRGFLVELNEIDANLGGSPLIRDCKTLARRDRNEEPTLVSYIVLEIAEWKRWLETQGLQDIEKEGMEMGPCIVYLKKRFRRIQAEVRDHLKSRLPAHSVPSIYIVLQKLPLNPNGKVDSPNLPFPDASLMMEDALEEDLKSWKPDSSFFDCGGHSLLAQQLLLNIRKNLDVDIAIGVLYEVPEVDYDDAAIGVYLSWSRREGSGAKRPNAAIPYGYS
ncbi:L-aminoadipate-semialdehyde dehydrogenase large subunit [Fusarium albosuccineum]|uniref:L-aminoadipate-semialdehyde dehydrogenase large subunit n=1 Tax=Fusarium albosuccineum TaxID=1237068 RepID=A0A8H4P2G2_9HYPO|nr:L-aminoadipate-semialdehyde dehydrogenase large subunit [Fusarium albosuccineum]